MGLVQYFEWRHFKKANRRLHEYFGKETLSLTVKDGLFITPEDPCNKHILLEHITAPITYEEIIDIIHPDIYRATKLVRTLFGTRHDTPNEDINITVSYAFFFSAVEYAILHNLKYHTAYDPQNSKLGYNHEISLQMASLTGMFLSSANTAFREGHSIRPERWDFESIFHYASVMMALHCEQHDGRFDTPHEFEKIPQYLPTTMRVGGDFERIMLKTFKDRFATLSVVQHLLQHRYGPGILIPIEKDVLFNHNRGTLTSNIRIMDYMFITEDSIYPIDLTTGLEKKYKEMTEEGKRLQTGKDNFNDLFNALLKKKFSIIFDGCTVDGVAITHP